METETDVAMVTMVEFLATVAVGRNVYCVEFKDTVLSSLTEEDEFITKVTLGLITMEVLFAFRYTELDG